MINLLPPSRLANMRIAHGNTVLRRYIEFGMLSLLLLIAAAIMAYYFLHTQQINTKKIVDINQQKINTLEPTQKQAEELSNTVNTIASLFAHNIKFSDMLTQIGGLMPPGSVLTGIQFSVEDLKSPLEISAEVDNEQKAAILRNNLATSNLFSQVDIKTISKSDTPEGVAGSSANTTQSSDNQYPYTAVLEAYFKKDIGSNTK